MDEVLSGESTCARMARIWFIVSSRASTLGEADVIQKRRFLDSADGALSRKGAAGWAAG